MTTLRGKTVLITGATGGFGRELTRQLIEAGSRLLLTDLDENKLLEHAAEFGDSEKDGEIVQTFTANLAQAADGEALYKQIKEMGETVDILINNAGIAFSGRFDEVPTAEWEKLMEINLITPMRLSGLFAADMVQQGSGHIVNISSVAGWVGVQGLSAYNASKFGLRGFGEGLHAELSPHGVQVTNVYPYFSKTPILNSPQYGSLATGEGFPEGSATDPADVMAAVLRGVENNTLHVFPDRVSKIAQFLKRHTPRMFNSLMNVVLSRAQ